MILGEAMYIQLEQEMRQKYSEQIYFFYVFFVGPEDLIYTSTFGKHIWRDLLWRWLDIQWLLALYTMLQLYLIVFILCTFQLLIHISNNIY